MKVTQTSYTIKNFWSFEETDHWMKYYRWATCLSLDNSVASLSEKFFSSMATVVLLIFQVNQDLNLSTS